MTRPSGDDLLVRRAARRFAVQAAALVAAAMLLLVVAVGLVVVRGQHNSTDALLESTVANADDVDDPPPGAWIVLTTAAGTQASPGLPVVLADRLSTMRAGSGRSGPQTLSTDENGSYRVLTRQEARRTVQVVVDLRPQHQERDRLLRAMAAAGAVSLLVAAALGAWLGRRSVRPLAAALALQRGFVADASHELRTPLTLLSTRVQLLERALRDSPDAQLRSDAQGVVRDVQRLGEVVEDLLVAADPRRDDEHAHVDVGELLAGVAESAHAHAAAAGVHLVSETSGVPGELAVQGASPALRRAVLALVDNAIEHTPRDGSVFLAATRRGPAISILVSDTGPGIALESAGRLLHRFHSGGQRSGRAHYGLGLALTHDVANRHGGQLRLVPSTSGATFELTLPAASGRAILRKD